MTLILNALCHFGLHRACEFFSIVGNIVLPGMKILAVRWFGELERLPLKNMELQGDVLAYGY